jgi:predicted AAA+ superfamily ATPase
MALRPEGYRPRLADARLDRLLGVIGAVSIEGPKWCGKTWTALAHASSAFFTADPDGGFQNREIATLAPNEALDGSSPRVLDEWQEAPALWDAVRFRVDQNRGRGLFLLTGSASPAEGSYVHSGTGRIAHLRMRTMTLTESGESSGRVSLTQLLDGEPAPVVRSALTLRGLARLAARGGWPGAIDLPTAGGMELARAYLDTVATTDISAAGGVERDPARVRALLGSLARNTATLASITTVARDIGDRFGETLSLSSARAYLAVLRRMYLIEEIPAWSPAVRSPIRVRTSPKRMLADPSLAVAALGLTPDTLLADLKTFGLVFESLCLRDLLVYADALGGWLFHYHDAKELEADAVLTLPDGRWAAIEIKLGFNQVDKAAASLLKLRDKLTAAGDRPPACLAVIVGVGAHAHTRPDGVTVIPVDALGL